MKIVTSCAPYRIERQRYCIESWLKYGYEVIAIQPSHQVESTKLNFPNVTVVESKLTGEILNKPNNIRIAAHLDIARQNKCNILLINSDIELTYTKDEFSFWETLEPNELKAGVRWDIYNETDHRLQCSGIDVFLISPTFANKLSDLGFTIGTSMWDYWIVWEAYIRGFKITTETRKYLIHQQHDDRWSTDDWLTSVALFNKYFIDVFEASPKIVAMTGRPI